MKLDHFLPSSPKVSRVSPPGRIECPHCRQSIKRPPLPPGEKCLCPKCNQPFILNAAGEGVTGSTPTVPPAPQPTPPQPTQQPPAKSPAPAASLPPAATLPPAPAPKPTPKPAPADPPKPPEFRINCYLCGSLLYARVDQIGSKVQCPDCHAQNEVRTPKKASLDSSDKPSLVGTEEFRMSDPGERPKFSPIEQPSRDEEDEENEFKLKPMPVTPTETGAKPARPGADDGLVDVFGSHGGAPVRVPGPPKPLATNPPASTTAATQPVHHPAPGANPATAPPSPPTKKYRKREESFGDELWSDGGKDAHLPRYKRSPFLVGVVEFLLYPGTISRWLMLTGLAIVPITLIELAAGSATKWDLFTAGSVLWGAVAAICGLVWSVVFGAHVIAIVDDTGNGLDAVENWPLVGEFPRSNPLYLPAALMLVAFVSLLVSLFMVGSSWLALGPVAMLVAGMLLLPLAWLPMLLEKSFAAPFQSRLFWQSFRDSGDGWFVFGIETLMLGLVGAIGVSLWGLGSIIVSPLSAALLVSSLLIYVRLLGRLFWYINPEMIPPPPPAKPGPPPLPETVDPTQLQR